MFKLIFWPGLALVISAAAISRGAVSARSGGPVFLAVIFITFLWAVHMTAAGKWKEFVRELKSGPHNLLILALAVLSIASAVFSVYKHASVSEISRSACYILLFYAVSQSYSRNARRNMTIFLIIFGTGLSLYGLLQYFGFIGHSWWKPPMFLSATYVNHNHFAGLLELIIPVSLGALLRYKNMNSTIKLAVIEAVIVMTAAFIFAQSRGAWISLGASLIVMNIVLVREKVLGAKSYLVLASAFIIIISLAVLNEGLVRRRVESFNDLASGETSLLMRSRIWSGTLEMIKDNWLIGAGIGTYDWAYAKYRPEGFDQRAVFAHNDYLQLAAESGVMSALIFIALLCVIISSAFRMARHPVILGCGIGCLSLSLHGLTDFNFHIPANMILFIVYCGFIIGHKRR